MYRILFNGELNEIMIKFLAMLTAILHTSYVFI